MGVEPNGAYGVDLSGGGSLADLRFVEASPVLGLTVMADESTLQRPTQVRNKMFGFAKPTFELTSHLCGSGQTLNAASTPTLTTQNAVIGSILGGYSGSNAGTQFVSAASNVYTVTATHGARFPGGSVAWIEVTTNVFEPTVIVSNTANTITLGWLPSAVPAASNRILNSQHMYPEDPTIAQTSLQALWETQNREHIFLLCGLQATSFGIDLTLEQPSKWTASLAGQRYLHDDDIATPVGGSPIGTATYNGGEPVLTKKGGFLFGPIASTTRTHVCESELAFSPGISHVPVQCASEESGIKQMFRQITESTLSFKMNIDDTNVKDLRAAMAAKTLYKGLWWASGVPGDQRALVFSSMQITAVDEAGDLNGLRAAQVTCTLQEDQLTVGASNGFGRAPYRLAVS